MLEKIHIMLSLFSGIIVTALSIYQGVDFIVLSVRLLFVMSFFYIFGRIVKYYITKKIFPEDTNIELEALDYSDIDDFHNTEDIEDDAGNDEDED